MICTRCRTKLEPRKRSCGACGKKIRPNDRKHGAVTRLPMEVFVEANDGYPGCWVCRDLGVQFAGKPQKDHWHSGPFKGEPRGVLCPFHNRSLGPRYSAVLLASLTRYVSRRSAA